MDNAPTSAQTNELARIVMCGCTQAGWEIINFLLRKGIKIQYFVSITEDKARKLGVSGYRDFGDLAKNYGIPIYYAQKYSLKSAADVDFFRLHQFDLLIQGGWQRLFPDDILSTLKIGAIGIHGSSEFLPKGRGRSPINWSLIEGKKRFIIHYFLIKPGVDDGDIFHYDIFDINDWDDCNTLYYKNVIITRQVLLKWIPRLMTGEYALMPQSGTPTYYPKRTPEDGLIDWEKSVFDIYNFIRALTKPYPGAFSFIDGERITIWKAQPFDTRITYPFAKEGTVTEIFDNGDFVVHCNGGLLLVTNYDFKGLMKEGAVFENETFKSTIPSK